MTTMLLHSPLYIFLYLQALYYMLYYWPSRFGIDCSRCNIYLEPLRNAFHASRSIFWYSMTDVVYNLLQEIELMLSVTVHDRLTQLIVRNVFSMVRSFSGTLFPCDALSPAVASHSRSGATSQPWHCSTLKS